MPLILAAASATAAIVVRSNGPSAGSYPPGKVLADNTTITLNAGDSVTVLDARGTRVLTGPGARPVAGSGTAAANGISVLLADTGRRQVRTGATRGDNGVVHPANVWQLDTASAGAFCVLNPRTLTLWRAQPDAASTITITRLGDHRQVAVTFRAGETVHAWPTAELPVAAAGAYQIVAAGSGTGPGTTVTLKPLATAPTALETAAASLLAEGCTGQLDLLVSATTLDPAG